MLRTAFRPRWLVLLTLVLVAATGMSLLGQWQLDRARSAGSEAQREAEQRRAARPPVPLGSVLTARRTFPAAAAGRAVLAEGRWDGDRQRLVADREQDGRAGFWVLTPLLLADGSAVPVVRGWVPAAGVPAAGPPRPASADAAQAQPQGQPRGQVEVRGTLQPSEPPAERQPGQGSGLPAGQLGAVSVVDLLDQWPYPLLTGYLLMTGQQPAANGPQPVVAQLPEPESGLAWRNLSYALQWWLFAAFGLFFWYRLVRDDHRNRLPAGPAGPAAPTRPDVGTDPDPVPAGRVGEDDRS